MVKKMSEIIDNIVDEILKKIPKPNIDEIPELYSKLNEMSKRIVKILSVYGLLDLDQERVIVRFDKADENIISKLILEDPEVMIPFFVTICGFSQRELERLYKIKNIYSLRGDISKTKQFSSTIKEYLNYPYGLETVIYKFYKNWEEHQKRHFRGRKAEELVAEILRKYGYAVGKIKVACEGEEREIDLAIPPISENIRVAIMVRHGVRRDLTKRAKEFSAEFDKLLKCYPEIKFVVVYLVPKHEIYYIDEIRMKIESEREGKKPFDLVILTEDELRELLPRKLEEWKIPKNMLLLF